VPQSINSIVLKTNGISFALQAVLFLFIGSFADYGQWRPWILIFWTVLSWGVGFGWLGVHDGAKWQAGTALYILGRCFLIVTLLIKVIGYQLALTFWTAAFPRLARDTPELQLAAKQLRDGAITEEQYSSEDSIQRNRLANLSFYVCSCGEVESYLLKLT